MTKNSIFTLAIKTQLLNLDRPMFNLYLPPHINWVYSYAICLAIHHFFFFLCLLKFVNGRYRST